VWPIQSLAELFNREYSRKAIPGESWPTRNVWSAAVLQAKNEGGKIGLRECIRPLLEYRTPGLNGMRCALVLFSNAALEGFSGLQASGAPGSTVVPSHGSPANLEGISILRSVVVGLQMWKSRSDFQVWRFLPGVMCGPSDCDCLW
jgi:hypothetical protein